MNFKADLLEQVKAATGPDKVLDASIELELDAKSFWKNPNEDSLPFTASIDAALALVERVLPGQHVTMGRNVHHHYWLCTFNALNDDGEPIAIAQEMHKSSLPLAILAALLSALDAQP